MGGGDEDETFADVLDVNLTGAWNTVKAAAPSMVDAGQGGAIVLISSTQGLSGTGGNGTAGLTAYTASKHGLVGLMRSFANWLAPHSIRVNTVHPTGVATPMILNEPMQAYLSSTAWTSDRQGNLLPVPMVESEDISDAVAWLVSDGGRYVTGVTLPVDAGFAAKGRNSTPQTARTPLSAPERGADPWQDAWRARSLSSPVPRAGRGAATRSGWPRRAPTSSPSTSASRSTR